MSSKAENAKAKRLGSIIERFRDALQNGVDGIIEAASLIGEINYLLEERQFTTFVEMDVEAHVFYMNLVNSLMASHALVRQHTRSELFTLIDDGSLGTYPICERAAEADGSQDNVDNDTDETAQIANDNNPFGGCMSRRVH